MPFDRVLDGQCKIANTSHTEMGKTARVARQGKEFIQFYKLDNPAFRQAFGAQQEKICDLLVDYRPKGKQDENRILLLVELSGKRLADARDQILGAARHIRSCLTGKCEIRSVVASSTVNPADRNAATVALQKAGISVRFQSVRKGEIDLGQYLRGPMPTVKPRRR